MSAVQMETVQMKTTQKWKVKCQKSAYWKIFLFILLAGACLSGCTKQEGGMYAEKRHRTACIAEGELSWGQGFLWVYHACAQDTGEEPKEIMQSYTGGEAKWEIEGYFATDWRRECLAVPEVELMRSVMPQEALLAHIDALAEELLLQHERVSCVIVGDAGISQLVRVDADREHWLYLQQGEEVYVLHGMMEAEGWQVFLDSWLGAGLRWGEAAVCESRSVFPADNGEKEGLRKWFDYEEFSFWLGDSRLLSCRHDAEGFLLKLEQDREEEEAEEESGRGVETCEFWLHVGEGLPDYGTEAEYLSYFVQKYPTLSYYGVELKNVDLKDRKYDEKTDYHNVWRQAEDGEGKYVFFYRDGIPCAAGVVGEDFIDAVYRIQWQSDYGREPSCFYWKREENGDIYCLEAMENFREYLERSVNGERLIITVTDIDDREDRQDEEIFARMEVTVRREGEETPFQTFYIEKRDSNYALPTYFEDINVDGYEDLIIVNTFGASNLNAGSYLWSPSEGRFLEDTGLLDFYSGYDVDTINRRIHVYTHGAAYIGSGEAYQWIGESDFEKIKLFSYAGVDMMDVSISRYEDGEEEVWVDCRVTMEEFDKLYKDFENSYEWDCVWEQEITVEETGEKLTFRYLELCLEEAWIGEGHYDCDYYEGGFFVYDEEKRLRSVHYAEFISRMSDIRIGNLRDVFPHSEYDGKGLIVIYEGSGMTGIPWEALIR